MTAYTDEEILTKSKITTKMAGDYLGISANAVTLGMRRNVLPIGFAVHNEEKDTYPFHESWSYTIVPERLVAYKHGRLAEIQVVNIEKGLNRMIEEFQQMRQDLLFLLSEDETQTTK